MRYSEYEIDKAIENFTSDDITFAQLAKNYAKLKEEGYNNEKLEPIAAKTMGHSYTVQDVTEWLDRAREHRNKTKLSKEELLNGTLALYQIRPESAFAYTKFFNIVFGSGPSNHNSNITQNDLRELSESFQDVNTQQVTYKYGNKIVQYAEERHLVLI